VMGSEWQIPSTLLYWSYHPCQHQHLEMSDFLKMLIKGIKD
jgi:hypothetical protein